VAKRQKKGSETVKWIRLLVYEGHPDWIDKCKDASALPQHCRVKHFGAEGTIRQLDFTSLEELAMALLNWSRDRHTKKLLAKEAKRPITIKEDLPGYRIPGE
jgi:hypothetical protein